MHLKYDNMHSNIIFNTLNCINNHVNLCTNCMLSIGTLEKDFTKMIHMNPQ